VVASGPTNLDVEKARDFASGAAPNLSAENEELRRALARRDLALVETNHRILNGLQLAAGFLRLEEMRTPDRAVRNVLASAAGRLDAVARFHRHISRNGNSEMMELAAYLKEIVPQIESLTDTSCALDCDPAFVDARLASDIGILINELVTNAAKHAYDGSARGTVEVACVRDGADGLMLSVRDHGSGFHADIDEKNGSLGMLVIHTLVKQHNGRLEVVNDGGAEFRVFLPSAIVSASAEQPL
jgi:two-component system, sensor histidine kinase PdtaS